MTLTTASNIAGPVNFVFQQTLLRNARPRCPHLAGSVPGDVLKSHSGTFSVKWRRVENLTPTTSALTALTGALSFPTRTSVTPTVTDVTATVAKYGQHIELNEEVDLVNYNGQTDGLIKVLGIQAGRSINRLQRNVTEDGLTLIYGGNGNQDSDVAVPMTYGLIRNAVNVLNNQSALTFDAETTGSTNVGTTPINASYMGICHSDVEEDIRNIANFKNAESYSGQTALHVGEFGLAGGVRWVSSPEASIDTNSGGAPGGAVRDSTAGGSADLYTSLILGMECHGALSLDSNLIRDIYHAGDAIPGIIVINNAKGSAGSADSLHEVATLGWKTWHAGAILNPAFGRGLRTAASVLE